MRQNRTAIFAGIAIAEALLILIAASLFFTGGGRVYFRTNFRREPVPAVINPLELALQYNLSDATFEQIVRDHLNWINYRPKLEGGFNSTILADCALLRKTNYVRILIKNGASVEEAVKDNIKSDQSSVDLLYEIQKGLSEAEK